MSDWAKELLAKLAGELGTAAALFTMEYNDAKNAGWHLDRGVDADLLAVLERRLLGLLEALDSLPLESFGDDMSKHDAADFVDHAGEFFQAMHLARAAKAKASQP